MTMIRMIISVLFLLHLLLLLLTATLPFSEASKQIVFCFQEGGLGGGGNRVESLPPHNHHHTQLYSSASYLFARLASWRLEQVAPELPLSTGCQLFPGQHQSPSHSKLSYGYLSRAREVMGDSGLDKEIAFLS